MKKMRLIALLMVCTIFIGTTYISASAQETNNENSHIQSRLASTVAATTEVTNKSTTITVYVAVLPKSSNVSTKGTVYLQKYSNGSWVSVKSWSLNETGTVAFSRTYTGSSGNKYRSKLSVKVGSDNISTESTTITIN